MKKIASKVFLLLIIVVYGCWKEGNDGFEYYESSFVDSISAVVEYDSVNIVITQAGDQLKDTIPYEIINNSNLGNTIKLKMDVNFGSPSKIPSPFKKLQVNDDTIHLFYTPYQVTNYKLSKSLTITDAETEPKAIYYSVQKVYIRKSSNKQIWFQSNIL